jgi:hypothetical protein
MEIVNLYVKNRIEMLEKVLGRVVHELMRLSGINR